MHIYDNAMTADVSLTAGVATTVWQLVTPATRWAKILWFAGGFRSTNSTDQPCIVELVRQSTAGTPGGSITPRPKNPAMPAALCSVAITFSGEPTLTHVTFTTVIPPQGGNFVIQCPLGNEWELQTSDRWALRLTCPQAQVFRGSFRFEE